MYVTDALRIISENTAKYAGGSYQKARWVELIHPPKEETRTPEEVIEHMKNRLREIG